MATDYPYPVLLARRELLTMSASDYQRMALHLIETGHDCSALHDLAWDTVISSSDAAHLFKSAAAQLGLALPTRKQAVEILLRYHATRILSGECSPAEGITNMRREAYLPEVSKHPSAREIGDQYDMQDFIYAYYMLGDLRDWPTVNGFNGLYGDEAKQAFDDEIRRMCRSWLERHPEYEGILG